jgi:hypothetical protein
MTQEFVPYELAVKLKALGFDEPCFGWFRSTLIPSNFTEYFLETEFGMNESPSDWVNSNFLDKACSAPLYQQAFRWFREKYDLFTHIEKGENPKNFYPIIDNVSHKYNPKLWFDTYEETELACLEKLIEIVESKSE